MRRAGTRRALWVAGGLVVGGLAAGCRQGGPPGAGRPPPRASGRPVERPMDRPADRPWYLGTEQVRQDVRELMTRVPGAPPAERTRIAHAVVAYGEPAVPQLAANLESSEPSVRILSAYALGLLRDPRSLDALAQAALTPDEALRYEAATAMVRMGDRRGVRILVDALEHPDPLVRARALHVLVERTGETRGYAADAHPEDRAAAIARWRAWLATLPARTPEGP